MILVVAILAALIVVGVLRDMRRWSTAAHARHLAAVQAATRAQRVLDRRVGEDRLRRELQAEMAETERELVALRFFDRSEWLS